MNDVSETTVLWRPVGRKELELIEAGGWRAFPPRLAHQPIFYPVVNEECAVRIARIRNTGFRGKRMDFSQVVAEFRGEGA